jgi:hypothetical protein
MRINEILPSTRAWAALVNVDLNFSNLMNEYIVLAKSFQNHILPAATRMSLTTGIKQDFNITVSSLNMRAEAVINDIKGLRVTNDSDLYSKIRKLKKAQLYAESLVNYL